MKIFKGKTADEIERLTEENAKNTARESSLKYLQETDWYVTRLSETGKPIPAEIMEQRETARRRINEIQAELKGNNNDG